MTMNSFIRVPPDSTGKRLFTHQHAIDGTDMQVQVMHVSDPDQPEQIQKIDEQGAASVRFSEGQPIMAGFGSLKVSNQRALGVYESTLVENPDFTDEIVGTASATYNSPSSSVVLATDSTSGSRIFRTSDRHHYYMPGTSNLAMMTVACGDTGKANNRRCWGLFTDTDGLFFALDGTTVKVVVRSSVTGSVVDTAITQANWNGDKLDGTGLSGVTLDITKINVWWIDYQWLGGGRVRFGIYGPDGQRITVHKVQNANTQALPFMRTGTLPVRFENDNVGTTASGSELRFVCAAVYAEGNFDDYIFNRFSTGLLTKNVAAAQTLLLALRQVGMINGKHNCIQTFPETLNIYTTQPIGVTLFQDVDYTGGTWNASSYQARLERSTDGVFTYAQSKPMKTWFFNAGCTTVDLSAFFEVNDRGIMVAADGTQQVWAFLAAPLTASAADVTINLSYKELG
jgi:hypothetical protein